MKITVIGNGRWGSFIAWYLDKINHEVLLYGKENSKTMQQFLTTRSNGLLTLPPSLTLCTNLQQALEAEVIVVSIPSQELRNLMVQLKENGAKNKLFVLCMKGLEIGTGKRLTQIVQEEADPSCRSAVWLGPGHVQEFTKGVPNCMVIDSAQWEDKKMLIDSFSSDLIRFYYGDDLLGNEIGAAAKNVVGIAAGMLDGFGLTSLKGALMSRGTREYARLIGALGGKQNSAYGLCHLGDYEATVFSQYSHNRMFGEQFVQNKPYDKLAEGYYTVKALMELSKETGEELPISEAIFNILYNDVPPKEALNALFSRTLKQEFWE